MRLILSAMLLLLLPLEASAQGPFGSLDIEIVAPEKVRKDFPFMVQLKLDPKVGENDYQWKITPEPAVPAMELETKDGRPVLWVQGITERTYISVLVQIVDPGKDPIGFDAIHIEVEGAIPPGPVPPDPDDPDIPIPTGLAGDIYQAAMKVNSPNRAQEAKQLAGVFRSVAARAAGLSTATPATMLQETGKKIQEVLPTATLRTWNNWEQEFIRLLKAQNLGKDDKPGHIEAWNAVATGLESVK